MKFRQGFVSNSSSSSFVIYGVSELAESLSFDIGINQYSGISDYSESEFIGINAYSLDENKTIKDQKLELLNKIQKKLPDVTIKDIHYYEDFGYDG